MFRLAQASAAALLLLALCAPAAEGRPSRAVDPAHVGCEVGDLSAVFANPMKYDGRRFCGRAYFVRGAGFFVFDDVRGPRPETRENHPILVPQRALNSRVLKSLHSDDEVYVSGMLRVDRYCFVRTDNCVPWGKPIYLDRFYVRRRRARGG